MNLLSEETHWLPFRLRDGTVKQRPLVAICDPDVMDFALPRADFQGAAYQFAIGVLQTAFAPEDEEGWETYFESPPSIDLLLKAFKTIQHAFNVRGDGPLFMQDYDPLAAQKPTTVSGLLIEAPGANGIKHNTDHFIKRGLGEVVSLEMAVLALFTLQINAPSGGQGHRVGLRGGGPLTTLVLPQSEDSNLWQKLWLNVMHQDFLAGENLSWAITDEDLNSGRIFPWLAPTRESSQKGSEIYAPDVHPLHMYWAMPRRIRLEVLEEPATCLITGQACEVSVKQYRTQNYGGNYVGNWGHPFTPYQWDPKKPEQEHLSVKGQPGGINYKTWQMLTMSAAQDGFQCARVVRHFQTIYDRTESGEVPRLWVFGYDMDNMKARGWYATTLPLFHISPEVQDRILIQIQRIQALAHTALWQTRSKIKEAIAPKESKGDLSFIDFDFWRRSEPFFFQAVTHLIAAGRKGRAQLTPEQADHWLSQLRSLCFDLFDEYALSTALDIAGEHELKKRIVPRILLKGWFFTKKKNNDIRKFIDEHHILTQRN